MARWRVTRRGLLSSGLAFACGTGFAAAAAQVPDLVGPDRLPRSGGYAPGGVERTWSPRGALAVRWHVDTARPLVALTFDDGPGPRWTPMVLDALEQHRAPATFFVVGRNLARYGDLVRGRLERHEVGNHTWAHRDLAQLDEAGVREQLARTHATIREVTGQTARLMRPPWGHLAGSTLVVADEMGYDVVMWSQQMHEKTYLNNQPAQVSDIVDHARPGSIVLAHDVGNPTRLVALRQLGAIITGLRDRGFELVTVSELIAAGGHQPAPGQL